MAAVRTRAGPLPATTKLSSKGTGKAKPAADKAKKGPEIPLDESDDDMTTSFLQFCTNCDTQILVPKTSILYCSERCKRMDADHVSSYTSLPSLNSSTSSDEADPEIFGSKHRGPVAPAVPTPRPKASARIPPKAHEGNSDLDPTEWKPKLPHRPNSVASDFLGQFHRTPPRSFSPRRPAGVSAPTMSPVPMTAPSLSATPTASSTSSSANSEAGTPYDFVDRPPMRRCHDPKYSDSAATKPPNLMTPRIPSAYSVPAKPKGNSGAIIKVTAPPATVSEAMAMASDLSYEKKWNLASYHSSMGSGSLTTLLGSTTLGHKATM
ncbi:MAG: hypothetical protein Q9177_003398 [Variospora cf. flavescens]